MGHISEFFGYPATDQSDIAKKAAEDEFCHYLGSTCIKTLNDGRVAGACTLKPATSGPVICCPIRLYAEDYKILRDIADRAFTPGLQLVKGAEARAQATKMGTPVVGVFGQRWGGELRLPKREGVGSYFVDWVLALVEPDTGLKEFVAVEVQTIDTTGNYHPSRDALLSDDRTIVNSTAGLNWENVNKRILPQLIYKGQVLQREEACAKGLFFVCPTPVYNKIMGRLGGENGLTSMHLQPGSITFMAYDYDPEVPAAPGTSMPLRLEVQRTTSVWKLQDRFNNVDLPDANVYRKAIEQALSN
ncbi:NotI family restriction endonuclease [Arthrobacter sp. MI7-26]|uniref:NotI family restriction endonuclease n=1 Tax=Arthrobacter sp. MI7-26 TaxID=2993653 RepID=UPI0022492FC5|nr:NotI family restriction endonuclease [Arthrobacter sp. MI7-26]MCX2746278.1 NotI family restriction endonuclease [Arthrobacter sp. MI7-26]